MIVIFRWRDCCIYFPLLDWFDGRKTGPHRQRQGFLFIAVLVAIADDLEERFIANVSSHNRLLHGRCVPSERFLFAIVCHFGAGHPNLSLNFTWIEWAALAESTVVLTPYLCYSHDTFTRASCCSEDASIFVDFGCDWYFMLSSNFWSSKIIYKVRKLSKCSNWIIRVMIRRKYDALF